MQCGIIILLKMLWKELSTSSFTLLPDEVLPLNSSRNFDGVLISEIVKTIEDVIGENALYRLCFVSKHFIHLRKECSR